MLKSLFNRFTKYLNDNDSILIFKYDGNKIKYSFKGDNDHWYTWFKEKDNIKDNNLKDERLKFFIGKEDSFFNCPFRNEHKYKTINKCINFLHNSTSLEEIAFKMELMGI